MRKAVIASLLAVATIGGSFGYWQTGRDERYAREALSTVLKDSASAEFRNLRRVGDILCGEVNAKNSYGAFAGFSKFVIDSPRGPKSPPRIGLDEDGPKGGIYEFIGKDC